MSSAASMAAAIRFSACRFRSRVRRSLRALLDAGRAAQQHVVEIHPLRRAGDAHAPALPLPSPCAVTRRRLAGFVAIGEHDHVAHVVRQIESTQARMSKAPPMPGGRSPAWRRGRSRCPRRPSAHRPDRRGARRRRGMDRASSSAGRPAPCPPPSRARKVRWIASGVPSAPLVTSATIAGQIPPEGCFRPAWKRSASGGGRSMPREAR